MGAALNTAQVAPGSTVAVIGCGGVGQSVIQGARIAGASRIIAIDPVDAEAQDRARQFGATDLVDPGEGDPVEQVMALTGGRGVDYAFEVIGLPETIAQAFDDGPPGRHRGGRRHAAASTASVTLPASSSFFAEKQACSAASTARPRCGATSRGSWPSWRPAASTSARWSRATITLDEVNDAFRAMEAGEVIRSVDLLI